MTASSNPDKDTIEHVVYRMGGVVYPYPLHTGNELQMMLAGTKPLAAFCEDFPRNSDIEIIPEQAFSPHVTAGTVIKQEAIKENIRRVLYALPSEAWRINAYLLLWEVAGVTGWNESLERMEGRLLGYEEWQNDFHIENNYRRNIRPPR